MSIFTDIILIVRSVPISVYKYTTANDKYKYASRDYFSLEEKNMPVYFFREDETMSEAAAKDKPKERARIHFLDELRGFAVFCMVFYHAFYTVGYLFNWQWGIWLMNFFMPAEPVFAGLFIFISGIASNLSHSNIERGAKLFFIAYIITVVTWFAIGEDGVIRFGILHMLSVCMMLYGILTKVCRLIPLWVGFAVNAALFVLTINVIWGSAGIPGVWQIGLPAEWYRTDFLYPLGFPYDGFMSSDYFPLLPWLFLFFAGCFFGRLAVRKKFPKFTYKNHIPFFSFMGRHALLIYILHQPVIFGICKLLSMLVFKGRA